MVVFSINQVNTSKMTFVVGFTKMMEEDLNH